MLLDLSIVALPAVLPASTMQLQPIRVVSASLGAPQITMPRGTAPSLRHSLLKQAGAVGAGGGGASRRDASQRVLDILRQPQAPSIEQLDNAVEQLVSIGPGSSSPGPDTLAYGAGSWEMFNAPHIRRLSSLFGAKFEIRYIFNSTSDLSDSDSAAPQFVTNVRYQHPLLGAGWLSSSGTLLSNEPGSVDVRFNTFWVDVGGDETDLRPWLKDGGNAGDAVVTALGKASFLPQLARFPVLYLDFDVGLAVFRFPPLSSNIAVVRR